LETEVITQRSLGEGATASSRFYDGSWPCELWLGFSLARKDAEQDSSTAFERGVEKREDMK
jgi:hypothetical protein